MKLLHTSDWHLGRTLFQESLLADQAGLLDQVFAAVVSHDVDALIIAGDLFDRAVPSREAVQLFDSFLARVYRETRAAIIAIAGNHDAPDRIGFNAALQDASRVLIRGPLDSRAAPLLLKDAFGTVAISALPYAEIFAAREAFADSAIASPADVMAAQIAEARATVLEGMRWVVVAHAFVVGGRTTETERPLGLMGGLETVPATVFDGACYVALGHLHRPQAAGADHIRYSGAWMGFGFDEAGETKSMTLVELGPDGVSQLEHLPLTHTRPLTVRTGALAELLAAGPADRGRDHLIKAVLTDEGALLDPMGQLRSVYPNVLQVERQLRRTTTTSGAVAALDDRRDPMKLIEGFLETVRGEGPTDAERAVLEATVAGLAAEED
jgi:exonuclease SbcD